MPITQFPPIFNIANLNGKTGFSTVGPAQRTSAVGDINHDGISDLAINIDPKTYILFGNTGLGSSGQITLSDLNGSNGFVILASTNLRLNSWVSSACDINNDGIDDLVIGTNGYTQSGLTEPGITYVIFGHAQIGSSGTLSLSSINSTNGVLILSDGTISGTMNPVNCAGDVNADGVDDLIIGGPNANNYFGAGYIVFGKSNISGSTGRLLLSSLNGSNGFTIPGNTTSHCGTAVDTAGDINADGISDFVIGAPNALGTTGVAYVIFGSHGIGKTGTFSVSTLNGKNGFVARGITTKDYCGGAVSTAGDINGDGIQDLAIGAPNAFSFTGSTYLIYGNSKIGSSGLFNLATLNGTNGFVFTDSKTYESENGASVSGIGDINGDFIDDLVIGAPNSYPGKSYVVFGSKSIANKGILDASTLNGATGFAIPGTVNGDRLGISVSGVGDVNNDGIPDIGIAREYSSFSDPGASYIIFGEAISILSNNNMTIAKGQTKTITSINLNATYIKFPSRNQNLIFSISNSQNGQFEQVANPGIAITSFTQQLVIGSQIQFVHDGSVFPPSFSVSLGDGKATSLLSPQPAAVHFIHLGPKLVRNTLVINQGQTVIMTIKMLGAIDQDNQQNNPNLIFIINHVQHGQFELVINPGVAVTRFLQSQIQIGNVQFIQDGSVYPPSYNVQVNDGPGGITTASQAASIAFNLPPVLINNRLSVNQGQAVIINSSFLSATDPDDPAESLVFLASNVVHGHFESISDPGTVILSFSQAEVLQSDVQFIPDGSQHKPSYNIAVTDGKATTLPQPSTITFNLAPQLNHNQLFIQQGKTVVLTTSELSAKDPDDPAETLLFVISDVFFGHFEYVARTGLAITRFYQASIINGTVQFAQNGSPKIPSYNVAVSDGKMIIPPQPASITFNAAPILTSNQLSIAQGQSVIITPSDLSASDDHTPANELIFTASRISHGHFEDSSTPGIPETQFSQQRIFNGALKFVTDGSGVAPSYNITVSDGSLSTLPAAAIINFSLLAGSLTSNDVVRNAIISGVVSGVVGLGFFALKAYLERKAAKSLQRALDGDQTEAEQRLLRFKREVIRPVANKVFERIKTTNLIGYRSEKNTKAYIAAIETLLGKLVDENVNLDFSQLDGSAQNRLINEIAKQIRQELIPDLKCCSMTYVCSFFKPEVTPEQIEANADIIAHAIAQV